MKLFSKYFYYERPDRMVKILYNSKSKGGNNNAVSQIDDSFNYFAKKVIEMPTGTYKKEKIKILDIVNKILNFDEQNQEGSALKFLIPNQMLGRLPISLAQLKAGNNSVKLKNEVRQLLYSLYR